MWPIWASQLPDTGVAAEFYDKGALVQPIVASFCSIRASVVTMRLCIDAGHMMTNVHDVSCANLQHHGKNNSKQVCW